MKRLLVVLLGVGALLALTGVNPGPPVVVGGRDKAQGQHTLRVTDAGYLLQNNNWDGDFSGPTTITSTGSTNHASGQFTAGKYVRGQCTAAAYVGASNTLNADAGPVANVPSCASADGGTIPVCPLRAANEVFYVDLRGSGKNALGVTSSSGTANCLFWTCNNCDL